MKKYITIILLTFIAVILYITVYRITEQDNLNSPTYIYHTSLYLENSYIETGMKNIVEAITINYRSIDTIGGIMILLTSIVSVSSLLRGSMKDVVETEIVFEDVILKTVVRALVPLCFVFAFYTFLIGDVSPGGGFQSGLVFAATIITMGFAYGCKFMQNKFLFKIQMLIISISFLTIMSIGLIGPFLGLNLFSYYFPETTGYPEAKIMRLIITKIFSFCIALIVGMSASSLFYVMTGEDS
ncbi:MAG: hypothetical protein HY934_11130 [Candidatus Firestonebacteria bacterium]|nr:hypothetical protein [Candidatus Firestonebacteria bacterium]